MTSSLVGSEMCIRDSARDEQGLRGRRRSMPQDFDDEAREEAAQEEEGPVSYTHLTLPTICSV
eukprot:1915641-Prorocentrum_lima.AAC.1